MWYCFCGKQMPKGRVRQGCALCRDCARNGIKVRRISIGPETNYTEYLKWVRSMLFPGPILRAWRYGR
jgi:hypothetical protein